MAKKKTKPTQKTVKKSKTLSSVAPKRAAVEKPLQAELNFVKFIQKETGKVERGEKKFKNVATGLGLFGVLGMCVVLPIVVGIVMGRWFDRLWDDSLNWTLILMFLGLGIGLLAAVLEIKKNFK